MRAHGFRPNTNRFLDDNSFSGLGFASSLSSAEKGEPVIGVGVGVVSDMIFQ